LCKNRLIIIGKYGWKEWNGIKVVYCWPTYIKLLLGLWGTFVGRRLVSELWHMDVALLFILFPTVFSSLLSSQIRKKSRSKWRLHSTLSSRFKEYAHKVHSRTLDRSRSGYSYIMAKNELLTFRKTWTIYTYACVILLCIFISHLIKNSIKIEAHFRSKKLLSAILAKIIPIQWSITCRQPESTTRECVKSTQNLKATVLIKDLL